MKDVENNIDFQISELGHQLDSDITKLMPEVLGKGNWK